MTYPVPTITETRKLLKRLRKSKKPRGRAAIEAMKATLDKANNNAELR